MKINFMLKKILGEEFPTFQFTPCVPD